MISPACEKFASAAEFFASETLSHFIQTHHHGLHVLHTDATLKDALKVLHDNKILSVPVLDSDEGYAGCISINDILRGLERSMEANLGENYMDSIPSITAEEMDNIGNFFASKSVGSLLHDADLWMKGEESTNLMTVVKKGFNVNGPKVHHRIYICDPAKPTHHLVQRGGKTTVITGNEKDAWRPTDVVSQYDLVKLLWEHRDQLGIEVNNLTLDQLGLADSVVYTLTAETPALVAVHHMAVDRKSGVGIVDNDGKLIGNLSASDLRDIPVEHFGVLTLPLGEFISVIHGTGPSVEEALKGKRPEGSATEMLKETPLFTLTAKSTLGELLEMLISHQLHRIYVVDEAGKPASVITLTDILRLVAPRGRYSMEGRS